MKITNMEREIKFRAWEVNKGLGGRMTEPFTLIDIHNRKYVATGFADRIEFMQFTGLLDKNGKEIYEGDIVEMTDPYGEDKLKCEIKYENGAFTVEADGWFGMGECDVTAVGWAQEQDILIEVIGNIFENTDLL